MTCLRSSPALLALCAGLATAAPALAQSTGSRIQKAPSQPVNIIRFDEPSELRAIRNLLNYGKVDEAIEMSRSLIASDPAAAIRYAGYNALCASLSAARDYGAAIEACDTAIRIQPGNWMAYNSRGSIRLVTGQPELALADYEFAREAIPSGHPSVEIVEYNLSLVRSVLGPSG